MSYFQLAAPMESEVIKTIELMKLVTWYLAYIGGLDFFLKKSYLFKIRLGSWQVTNDLQKEWKKT